MSDRYILTIDVGGNVKELEFSQYTHAVDKADELAISFFETGVAARIIINTAPIPEASDKPVYIPRGDDDE